MKKFLVTLLTVLMVINLVGCGSKTDDKKDTGNSTDQSSSSTDNKDNQKAKKVVIWAWDQNFNVIDYATNKYKTDNPDVKVEFDVQNVPDTVEKLSTFLASGVGTDLPDIVLMDNNEIQSLIQQFPGQLVNLSERGYDEFKDSFSQAHWEVLSSEGSIYAFPFDIAPLMLQVNTEIFEKAGVDANSLKTWQDIIDATDAVVDAGFGMNYDYGNREVLGMMQSAGVGIYDSEGKIDLLNPKVVECVNIYKNLIDSNGVDPNYGEADAGTGKVALAVKPAWLVGDDMNNLMDISGKVTLVPLPKVNNADTYTSSANDGGSSWFILDNSEVKDIAFEIGKIMTTDLEAQKIALADGLMPGFLPAAELDEVQAGFDYYQGQAIWKLLSDSAVDTKPIYVNQHYSLAKDIFSNSVIDPIRNKTDKDVKEILKEATELLSVQTGREVNEY